MNRLELPSKGIIQERYNRVYAPLLAQLQAFVPEDRTVTAFCEETGLVYTYSDAQGWVLAGAGGV